MQTRQLLLAPLLLFQSPHGPRAFIVHRGNCSLVDVPRHKKREVPLDDEIAATIPYEDEIAATIPNEDEQDSRKRQYQEDAPAAIRSKTAESCGLAVPEKAQVPEEDKKGGRHLFQKALEGLRDAHGGGGASTDTCWVLEGLQARRRSLTGKDKDGSRPREVMDTV